MKSVDSNGFSLSDRMKEYEAVFSHKLPRRSYAIIRIDGRAFHTWTKHLQKPFDLNLEATFKTTVAKLFNEVGNLKIAYQQSDEISLLLTDFNSIFTQPWFDNRISKLVSVSASLTTAFFNEAAKENFKDSGVSLRLATFDARCFILPDEIEVFNYFLWRSRDCVRNSISALGQANFSHTQLHGLRSAEIQAKLLKEKKIDWADQPAPFKYGLFSFVDNDSVFVQQSLSISFSDDDKQFFRKLIPIKQ